MLILLQLYDYYYIIILHSKYIKNSSVRKDVQENYSFKKLIIQVLIQVSQYHIQILKDFYTPNKMTYKKLNIEIFAYNTELDTHPKLFAFTATIHRAQFIFLWEIKRCTVDLKLPLLPPFMLRLHFITTKLNSQRKPETTRPYRLQSDIDPKLFERAASILFQFTTIFRNKRIWRPVRGFTKICTLCISKRKELCYNKKKFNGILILFITQECLKRFFKTFCSY